jgi:hypothetical protein
MSYNPILQSLVKPGNTIIHDLKANENHPKCFKTIIAYALASLVKGVQSVIVVRNLEDYLQIFNDIKETRRNHLDYLGGNFNGYKSIYPCGVDDTEKWINEDFTETCMVLMGNGNQIRKFLNNTKDKNQTYNVFIDDVEQLLTSEINNDKNGDKSLKTTIQELCDNSIKIFMVI